MGQVAQGQQPWIRLRWINAFFASSLHQESFPGFFGYRKAQEVQETNEDQSGTLVRELNPNGP